MSVKRKTTNGYEFLISEQDVDFVDSKNWFAQGSKKHKYVATCIKEGNKYKIKYLHRLLFNLSDIKVFIDHINHNTLDNTRENLRISNNRLNQVNRTKKENCSSKYIGVARTENNSWEAKIRNNKKRINLGRFKTEEMAALAYNEASIKINGNYAFLNKLSKSPEEIKLLEEMAKNQESAFYGLRKSGKKWGASIPINGKKTWLGTFQTKEEALQAIENAKKNGQTAKNLQTYWNKIQKELIK